MRAARQSAASLAIRPSQVTPEADLESRLLFSPGHRRRPSEDDSSTASSGSSGSSSEEEKRHRRRRRRAGPAATVTTGTSPTVAILLVALLVAVGIALYFALRGGNLFGSSSSPSSGGSAAAPATTRPTSNPSSSDSDQSAPKSGDTGPARPPEASGSSASGSGVDGESTHGPSPSSSPTGGSSSGGPLVDDSLKGHNDFRATHHADALTWNDTLAEAAVRWVKNCVWEHSGGSLLGGGYGENLWMSSSMAFTKASTASVLDAVASWNDEEHMYDYGKPGFTHETGHFTQDIWVGTKSVGCAMGTCMGLMSSGQWAVYYVCEYFPPGNWEGQFPENVLPP